MHKFIDAVRHLAITFALASCANDGYEIDSLEARGRNCGDRVCRGAETCETCPVDCGACEALDGGADAPSAPVDAASPDASTPTGQGIAANYVGDVGIASDPRVIFADDFESYASGDGLGDRWDAVYHLADVVTDPVGVYAGTKALQFTAPRQSTELSNGVAKVLANELDVLYLRYYSKYEGNFDITGSSHNGGGISAHYFVNGNATPGIPADGTNKFLVEFENWRETTSTASPGEQNVYVYHPEQRDNWGDHFFPDGRVLPFSYLPGNFGPTFVARPNFVPVLGRWYSYEVMVKANTPGQRDGQITCWIDGEIIADFPNLRLRDVDTLKIDRFNLSLHFKNNPSSVTRKWYDNVVAATAYIGPMRRQ